MCTLCVQTLGTNTYRYLGYICVRTINGAFPVVPNDELRRYRYVLTVQPEHADDGHRIGTTHAVNW